MRSAERQGQIGTSDQILDEIRDYCRATHTAESTFGRLVVNDGKLVSRLRDGARITTSTLDKVPCLSVPASRRCIGCTEQAVRPPEARQRSRCCHPWGAFGLPLLRQPAEIPALRIHLQREDRRRQPDFTRTRQSATNAAGASDLRRGRWRRHRAVACDAGAARPLSDHAALRRGEGNQL